MLRPVLQLLSGVTAVARAMPFGARENLSAVDCLRVLVRLLLQSCSPDVLRGALLQVAAAVELADLLFIGGDDSRQQGSSCSCGVHSSSGSYVAAIASGPNPQHSPAYRWAIDVLDDLGYMHQFVIQSAADTLFLARGLQLRLRHLAVLLAAAPRAASGPAGMQGSSSGADGGGSGGSSGGGGGSGDSSSCVSVPSCADPSLFLGGWDAAAVMLTFPHWAASGVMVSGVVMSALSALLEQPGAAACPRCTPRHLLMVVEGATRYCGLDEAAAGHQESTFLLLTQLLRGHSAAWRPWLPAAFMVPAVPTLTAWLLAAAQQLGAGSPAGPAAAAPGSAGSSGGSGAAAVKSILAESMYKALIIVLTLPGGMLLEVPDQHSNVPLEQLLGCCELLMRMLHGQHGWTNRAVMLGLAVMQVTGVGQLHVRWGGPLVSACAGAGGLPAAL